MNDSKRAARFASGISRFTFRISICLAALAWSPCLVGAQTVFDRMLAGLRSPSASDRIKAIREVQSSGYPDVFGALAPVVLDPDNGVQLKAIDALLTACLAPAPALATAKPFDAPNGSIAESVFERSPLAVLPRPIPAIALTNLSAATKDDEGRVRVAAAFALGVLGSPMMGPRSAEVDRALQDGYPYALRHPDPATREALVRAAARLFEPPPHASAPVAIADAVIAALNDEDERVRLWASDTLGWFRERRAVPALTERLAFYKHGKEADAALHALARIAQPESAFAFRQALTDRAPETRVIALEGLGRLRNPDAAPAIVDALRNERDPGVLLAGAFAYYLLGQKANMDVLVRALVNPETARQALVYLTELGAEAAPDLRPHLQQGDPALRMAVAEVLGLSGDAASLPVLEAAARDSDAGVAEAVRQALIRLRTLPAGIRVH
jgi:HEAT repeat protein